MPPELFYFRQKVKRMSIEQKDSNMLDLFRKLFDFRQKVKVEKRQIIQRLPICLEQNAKESQPDWFVDKNKKK